MKKHIICLIISSILVAPINAKTHNGAPKVVPSSYTSTTKTLQNITPEQELQRLIAGNERFVKNAPIQRNLLHQAKVTSVKGQFPGAVILSCMDSRGSPELIFDQGIGDVFSVRDAGNVIDADQLGGMEFATKLVGTKLIVVMGHTSCGAVRGACQGVELGNLTELLNKIKPAVTKVKDVSHGNIDCNDSKTINDIAKQNVLVMIRQIPEQSPIISEQIAKKQILLVGAMHDLRTGKVTFFNADGEEIH